MRRNLVSLLVSMACVAAHAQLATADPDWQEVEVPPPPALRMASLVGIDVGGSTLRWGVDPASIGIGIDGIVRYVVVATGSGGATNGIYEGVRCSTAEVKVYARHAPNGWVPAAPALWKSLHGNPATRHSLLIARGGACIGQGPNASSSQIVRDLGYTGSGEYRFHNGMQ